MNFLIKFLFINIFLITNSYSDAIKIVSDLVAKNPVHKNKLPIIRTDINKTTLLELFTPLPTCDSQNRINQELLLDCVIGRRPFFSYKCKRLRDIRKNCKNHNTPFKKVRKKNILKKNNSKEIKELLKSISTD